MPTFKSAAFAQQCYSSHPLSLSVKTLTLFTPAVAPAHDFTLPPQARQDAPLPDGPAETAPLPLAPAHPGAAGTAPLPEGTESVSVYRLVLNCDNCAMRHRFVIDALTSRVGQDESVAAPAMSQLSGCAAEHPADLRVSGMDVVSDSVRLMCGECRRSYDLTVSTVETYQK